MKKVLLVLAFSLFSHLSVNAGGLPRPMTDLSADLRNELDRARMNADEYKNLYLEQQAESKKLRSDLDTANQKCNDCYRDKAQLEGTLSSLRTENSDLNRRVGEFKAKADMLAQAPAPQAAKVETKKVEEKAAVDCVGCTGPNCSIFHRVFGTLVGAPVGVIAGTPIGAVRGSIAKGIDYADGFSEYMGPGILGEATGNVSGLAIGAVTGAFTGAAKGFTTGLKYGYSCPFSAQSFSLNGKFIDAYDPYDFSHLKKASN